MGSGTSHEGYESKEGGCRCPGNEGYEGKEGGCGRTGDEGHEGQEGGCGGAGDEGNEGKKGGCCGTSDEGYEGEKSGISASNEGYEGVSRRQVCQWGLHRTCLASCFVFGHRPTVLIGSRGARPSVLGRCSSE